jgi:hypothetical protein
MKVLPISKAKSVVIAHTEFDNKWALCYNTCMIKNLIKFSIGCVMGAIVTIIAISIIPWYYYGLIIGLLIVVGNEIQRKQNQKVYVVILQQSKI